MTLPSCPACGSRRGRSVADLGTLPALSGVLYSDRTTAREAVTGRIILQACTSCGHTYNKAFDPALVAYDRRYDNALDHSPAFNRYAETLAARLVDSCGLVGGTAIEVGCGSGSFLELLCQHGTARGLGFDPAAPTRNGPGPVTITASPLPLTLDGTADLVCCRHVLEHLTDPLQLLHSVLEATRQQPTPCYVEVPNGTWISNESGPWDVIYPHVSYFTDTSLRALLSRAGADVRQLNVAYYDQFLAAEVLLPGTRTDAQLAAHPTDTATTAALLHKQRRGILRWAKRLQLQTPGEQIIVWGAGSKGTTFLNLVDPASNLIRFAVDLNPSKWGCYIPRTGHQVLPPEHAALRKVDEIIVMNPVYQNEIRHTITKLGLSPRLTMV
ncbi:class I SAM-dependent methyltransferase [Streptomyces sp. NPDC058701]|uniref:class I SAM-dependent methyltransferase n=1 Tax=Streptomyces sp. NPDC058701 TaxID=3346608 RepID=UPI003661A0D0